MMWDCTARPGPWSRPLNFDLHVNWRGEPRVPFALYTKPDPIRTSRMACTSFPQFRSLPTELQRHVLHFCDEPTLYQLMQISVTRHEAKKVFWSNSNTWYCVDGGWLRYGAYTGETYRDLSFLAHVELVNISYDWLEPGDWIKSEHREEMQNKTVWYHNDDLYFAEATDQVLCGMEDNIRQFWQSLQDLCPRLTHVLISTVSRKPDPWDSPRIFLGKFGRLCPAGISVSVSLLQRYRYPGDPNYKARPQRNLWRLIHNEPDTEDQWEKVFTEWTPRIVLLPPKKFRGPVGAFQRVHYRRDRRMMQEQATELLLVDAIERHHFQGRHKPFGCLAPHCEAWFTAPGEYLLHSFDTGHYKSAIPPESFKSLFDEHSQRLHRLYGLDHYEPYEQDTKDRNSSRKTSSEVTHEDSCDEDQVMISELEAEELHYKDYFEKQVILDQREHDAMRAFLNQLQHDPLYVTLYKTNESRLLDSFLETLSLMREEDRTFRQGLGIFDVPPPDSQIIALQDGA